MTTGSFQRLLLSVATVAALAPAVLAPPASPALGFEPGSTFAKAHAPLPQPFGGFVPPGSTQGAFFGSGYEEWVQGLAEAPDATQAGGHPDFTASFQLLDTSGDPNGSVKDVFMDLPPGSIGNPGAVPPCEAADLNLTLFGRCPTESQLGVAATDASPLATLAPVSRLTPAPGEPLLLGFKVFGVTVLLHPALRSESDYGLSVEVRDAAATLALAGTALTLWGVPYDPVHDSHRFNTDLGELGASVSGPVLPFTSAPTDCATGPLHTEVRVRTWGKPEEWIGEESTAAAQTGCDEVGFDPRVTARPTTDVADSPTGLRVDVQVPQSEWCEVGPAVKCGLATSQLKDTRVTLPEGLALNPSGANGLAACSSAEAGLTSPRGSEPIRFDGEPTDCPDASKIGTAEIETPLLEAPIPGAVYLASPYDNPFRSLLAIYIGLDDRERGIVATFAGHVVADPDTGQLLTTVQDGPQLPIEHIRLNLKQGPHAPLRTPLSCGGYSTMAELTPYSAPQAPVALDDDWSIDREPAGGCDSSGPPSFDAGTIRPIAGVYSPLVLQLKREDGTQGLQSLSVRLPPGLTASIRGVEICPDLALASQGVRPTGPAGQLSDEPPLCPGASRVGSDYVGVGAGPHPYFLDQGPVYLAGPYLGAPFSLVVVVPARAGPFDLGSVVTRAAVFVDRRTGVASIVADPLPQILRGVPIAYRDLHLILDRPGLIRNPTSCEPTRITAAAAAADGESAVLSARFQVAECASLPFRPRVGIRLFGGLARNGHPRVRAALVSRGDEAGVRGLTITLPGGELLDIRHVGSLCRARQAAERCPSSSRLGYARIWSPLLDDPLTGPIYLGSPSRRFPDLFVDLRQGQLRVLLHGHTSARAGRLRVRFPALPDVPLSRAVLTLSGGRRGILVNSESLCRKVRRAQVALRAHSGRRRDLRPRLRLQHGRC